MLHHTVRTLTCSLILTAASYNLAHASYVSASAGTSTPSTQFTGDTSTSVVDDPFFPAFPDSVTALSGPRVSTTGLGFAYAAGSQNVYYGALKLSGQFRIDDLMVSYIGSGSAQSSVQGDVNISYLSNLTEGAENGNSTMSLKLDVNSGFKSQLFSGIELIDNEGVWSSTETFQVGSTFSLWAGVEMIIASTFANTWAAAGTYSMFLGGSPVFNLPEGYVVNSADGSIVNSVYMGPSSHTVVPVPAAIWLFGSGLIGLIGVARHRKA